MDSQTSSGILRYMSNKTNTEEPQAPSAEQTADTDDNANDAPPKEIGGRPGPDPTRYGDWEKNGRCIDF